MGLTNKNNKMKVNLSKNKSGHLLCEARINGMTGLFLIDTGASRTFICESKAEYFKIKPNNGQSELMIDFESPFYHKTVDSNAVVMSLSNVNGKLNANGDISIDGIIGSDILIKSEAIINYSNLTLEM